MRFVQRASHLVFQPAFEMKNLGEIEMVGRLIKQKQVQFRQTCPRDQGNLCQPPESFPIRRSWNS